MSEKFKPLLIQNISLPEQISADIMMDQTKENLVEMHLVFSRMVEQILLDNNLASYISTLGIATAEFTIAYRKKLESIKAEKN